MALVGCVLGWPSATHGQQATMPVIGFLSSGQPDVFAHLIDAFRQGLNEVGFVEGRNVIFEHRAVGNEYDRFRAMADDLVRRQVAAIFANGGTAAALAAKAATSTIPIIFYMGDDPVRQGVVASINRSGGNITGLAWFGIELGAKRLELLGELLPNVTVIAMLVNPNNPDTEHELRDVQEAARSLGRRVLVLTAGSEGQFDDIFGTVAKQQAGALVVASDPFFNGRRGLIVGLAARHRVPTIYERREFPDVGGLISYGHARLDAYRQLGAYTSRILQRQGG